jgi:hypothetical protein
MSKFPSVAQVQNLPKVRNKMKWIDGKEATFVILKYQDGDVLAEDYQRYLDEDELDVDDPLPFEDWLEGYLEDMEYCNSDEFQEEMQRLSEKD